jgi:hypothetical protein
MPNSSNKPYSALAVGSDRKLLQTESKGVTGVDQVLSQVQIMQSGKAFFTGRG